MTSDRPEIRRSIFAIDDASTNARQKQSIQRRAVMGKIVISTNVSLDGVVQDPDGEEGYERGGWFTQSGGKDLEPWAQILTEEAMRADAVLLSSRSDAWFGSRWADRPGAWADRLRSLPKYVVSTTLKDPVWQNTTVLRGELTAEVSKLKQDLDGEIVIYASYQLGQVLIEHDLVDEFRLFVFPVVVGAGKRLFGETSDKKPLRLIGTRTIGDGLVSVTYELVR
jgi:dihydrofolate reductase